MSITEGSKQSMRFFVIVKVNSANMDKEKTSPPSRRTFLKQSTLITAAAFAPSVALKAAENQLDERFAAAIENVFCSIEVNGTLHQFKLDPRVTLLDLLRERLHLTGTKKGCDYGQCGACTVHVDGQRVNSCLTLAVMNDGKKVTTIEGLANGEELHPMQAAFIKHDGFQCGYCTPGQIMSAVACVNEGHAENEADIREFMSGNICRCGAYPNIVAAIQDAKEGSKNR
ncbi:(2Fe-2S)-binding protein [Pedobacter sp.]|uniref:(2Fe-2S)-binding protein n=1 Tax=Pedobacter sp. TaxID=1411316 RepID=UPI003D7F9FEC